VSTQPTHNVVVTLEQAATIKGALISMALWASDDTHDRSMASPEVTERRKQKEQELMALAKLFVTNE